MAVSPRAEQRARRASLLIIEPDQVLASTMAAGLEEHGYAVQVVGTAADAKAASSEVPPDVILMELELPDVDGLVLCMELRRHTRAGIVVCTAVDSKRDRLLAYRVGAEDVILKPVDLDELAVRVDAVQRRAQQRAALVAAAQQRPSVPTATLGGLALDGRLGQATYQGRELSLTVSEYRILACLVSNVNRVVTRQQLAQRALNDAFVDGSRAVDMHVRRLRAKLRNAGADRIHLVPVRGQGYRLQLAANAAA